MFDWNEAVKRAIGQLDGQTRLIPGSQLRVELNRFAKDEVDEYVWKNRPKKFIELVQLVPGIQFVPRPDSDFLVGFEGAKYLPVEERRSRRAAAPRRVPLREDVFNAFTRVVAKPYLYVREEDRFLSDYPDDKEGIPVPTPTLDSLREQRRNFADEEVENETIQKVLKDAVDRSVSPLNEFMTRIIEYGLLERWRNFKYTRILGAIEDWATSKGLKFSPTWYGSRSPTHAGDSPQAVLARLAQFMSDEEIRALAVPFTAVEKMSAASHHEP